MEFKEFENPEQRDYDLKIDSESVRPPSTNYNDSLNSADGIDLNALGSDDFRIEIPKSNANFRINEFGEIIREEKGRTRK